MKKDEKDAGSRSWNAPIVLASFESGCSFLNLRSRIVRGASDVRRQLGAAAHALYFAFVSSSGGGRSVLFTRTLTMGASFFHFCCSALLSAFHIAESFLRMACADVGMTYSRPRRRRRGRRAQVQTIVFAADRGRQLFRRRRGTTVLGALSLTRFAPFSRYLRARAVDKTGQTARLTRRVFEPRVAVSWCKRSLYRSSELQRPEQRRALNSNLARRGTAGTADETTTMGQL